MKSKIAAVLTAAVALAAPSVSAADLPRRSAPPVAHYSPPSPALAWGGFYVGVNGGYGFSSFQDDGSRLIGSPSGGLIGVTGGYNLILAPQFLLGLEADFAFTGIGRSHSPFFGAITRGAVDDMLTVRGRAGYVMERALFFVTGGFAASKISISFTNGLNGFTGFQSSFQPGWALGAGLEYMLTSNFSAKGEYVFASTASDRYFDFSANALRSGVNTSSIKGGLNFHF